MESSILTSSSFGDLPVADYYQKANIILYFAKRRQLSGFQGLCNMELAVVLLSVSMIANFKVVECEISYLRTFIN